MWQDLFPFFSYTKKIFSALKPCGSSEIWESDWRRVCPQGILGFHISTTILCFSWNCAGRKSLCRRFHSPSRLTVWDRISRPPPEVKVEGEDNAWWSCSPVLPIPSRLCAWVPGAAETFHMLKVKSTMPNKSPFLLCVDPLSVLMLVGQFLPFFPRI